VAASPADGYVVGQVIALTVTAWAAGVGTPRLDGLEYVALMQNSPSMLFVSKNSPLQSFADLVAEAKARPGSIDVATSGVGTPDDITLRYLAANGIDDRGDPVRQARRALRLDRGRPHRRDLRGARRRGGLPPVRRPAPAGRVRREAARGLPGRADLGRVRARDQRPAELPALAVPAGTPPERVERLRAVAGEILASAEWQAFCAGTYTCTDALAPAGGEGAGRHHLRAAKGYLERFKTAAK
jgi:hypothetical protein